MGSLVNGPSFGLTTVHDPLCYGLMKMARKDLDGGDGMTKGLKNNLTNDRAGHNINYIKFVSLFTSRRMDWLKQKPMAKGALHQHKVPVAPFNPVFEEEGSPGDLMARLNKKSRSPPFLKDGSFTCVVNRFKLRQRH